MIFRQLENGKVELLFNLRERIKLLFTGKLIITDIGSRHFGNHLVKAVIEWQHKFDPKFSKYQTTENDPVETE